MTTISSTYTSPHTYTPSLDNIEEVRIPNVITKVHELLVNNNIQISCEHKDDPSLVGKCRKISLSPPDSKTRSIVQDILDAPDMWELYRIYEVSPIQIPGYSSIRFLDMKSGLLLREYREMPTPYPSTVYAGGPLFDLSTLSSNIQLAQEIEKQSKGKIQLFLPQSITGTPTFLDIRNACMCRLIERPAAIFILSSLDSGTIVEYIVSKIFDIPCVILLTDLRIDTAKEQGWNAMLDYWPRTKILSLSALTQYLQFMDVAPPGTLSSRQAFSADRLLAKVADEVIKSLEEICRSAPILTADKREYLGQLFAELSGLPLTSVQRCLSQRFATENTP